MSLIKKFKDYFGSKEDKVDAKKTEEQLFKMKDDILYYFQSLIDDSNSHRVTFGPRVNFLDIPYMCIELTIEPHIDELQLKRTITKFKEAYPDLNVVPQIRGLITSIFISYEPINFPWDN